MQASAATFASPSQIATARNRREQAFAAARRHSGWVRFMRSAIVVCGIGGLAGLTLMSVLDPFRVLPPGVSVSRAALNGTKVTMEKPKLAGFRKDGRAYAVDAASSVQDLRNPTKIDLFGVNAKIAMADHSNALVTAATGTYDTQKEQMVFTSAVHMVSESGYDLTLKSGIFDFKASGLSSEEAVVLKMNSGTINADTMQITQSGQKITFEGNVVSVILPAAESAAKVGLKGSSE